jgi:type VI secretion system secreted protein Hcp
MGGSVMAVVDYFLKIDGIEGESKDAKHKGEIDLESFSFGATQSGTMQYGGGGGAGKVQVQDFHFVMKTCKATPTLFLRCADGKHIPKAVLTARKAGGQQQEFLKWTFTDLIVSSFQTGASSSADVIPLDQISLNYSKIQVEYKEQKQDGTLGGAVPAGWDVKQNAPA